MTCEVLDPNASGTAVNCEKDGHCWHPGTAIGSLWCCRCGYPPAPNLMVDSGIFQELVSNGLEDLREGAQG